jgi:cholesterol transport system auxiliary component
MKAHIRPLAFAAFGAAALSLAGCSLEGLGSGPPPDLYVLSPKSTFSDDIPSVTWQLVVEEPSSGKGIDTDRIAIAPTTLEVKYLANSRWADRSPRMMQQLLIQSFENSKRIVSVGRQSLGLRSDYVLKAELREFQAEKSGETGTVVRVRLNLKLVRPSRGLIVASQSFESVKPAKSENVGDIVQSFDDAVGAVLKRAVTWTLQTGEADMKKNPKGDY